jgi:predicted MFS family arabinose efflux permease
LTLGGLPPDRLKSASGLFSLMRSLGGAIGIAACGTILNDRTNLHFLRVAEHLTFTFMTAQWGWEEMLWPLAFRGLASPFSSASTFSRPVVDLRALASRNFALGCWCSFVTGVGQFSMIYLIPVFLGSVRGFSSSQIGIAMLSAGVFQLCTIPIYSMFANRVDLRWLLMFGLACYGMSMWLS